MTDAVQAPAWKTTRRVAPAILACRAVVGLGFGHTTVWSEDPALLEPITLIISQTDSPDHGLTPAGSGTKEPIPGAGNTSSTK